MILKHILFNSLIIMGIIYLLFALSLMVFNILSWDKEILHLFIGFTLISCYIGNHAELSILQ